jgi:hypothetical protein
VKSVVGAAVALAGAVLAAGCAVENDRAGRLGGELHISAGLWLVAAGWRGDRR